MRYSVLAACGSYLALACAQANAQTPTDTATPPASSAGQDEAEIIVTAQKRDENINDVPMSITAVTGDQLVSLGINGPEDLALVVPSFNYAQTAYGTPVYSLRGVGYYESSLSAPPAVSVYHDQIPLPFSAMTRLGQFDVARVEVLKGPQGILFGENSTGGAINYVMARPTNTFEAGLRLGYGRFNDFETEAFVSGPISSTLNGRIAVRGRNAGDWQYNHTIPGETLGERHELAGRILLDWRPSSALTVNFNFSGWRDQSETQAAQQLTVDTLTQTVPALVDTPNAPRRARAANWEPDRDYSRDDWFYMAALRADLELSSNITATSLSSYQRYRQNYWQDQDGSSYHLVDTFLIGNIETFFQEVRVAGNNGPVRWVIGGNYQHDDITDEAAPFDVSECGCAYAVDPSRPTTGVNPYSYSTNETWAAFANVDVSFTDQLIGHAGIRYTDVTTNNLSGNRDPGDGSYAYTYNLLIGLLSGQPGTIQPGGDAVLFISPDPTSPTGISIRPGSVPGSLHEDNISWRIGLDYQPTSALLFYANVSRGYKAGSFPLLTPTVPLQFAPASQERVTAYELGAKITIDRLQINLAGFYYDYADKQIRGRILDPIGVFGALEKLVNVPESRLQGVELQVTYASRMGLTFTGALTYVDSKVTGSFPNFDPFGNPLNFQGMRFPFTPELSATADVRYNWTIGSGLNAFAGASVQYQTSINTAFADPALVATVHRDPAGGDLSTIPGDIFHIPGRALVSARVGLAGPNDRWRAQLWVENLFDEFYYNNVIHTTDTTSAFTGMPRTYGVTLSFNFH
jgi:outer membrane receptor protein involved in Fe transport